MSGDGPDARIRALFERFNAGDVEGVAALCHPDIEVIDAPELPGGLTYRGRGELARELQSLSDMFQGPKVTVDELRVGEDRAVALYRVHGHGQAGGVPIEAEIAYVFALDEGEIRQIRIFLDHAAGLAASGL